MRNLFRFFLYHYLFFLIFFLFFRIIFLVVLYPFSFEAPVAEILSSLVYGMKMDISIASYIFSIPLLLFVVQLAGFENIYRQFTKWYYRTIILIALLLSFANIIVFKNWGTLINNRALAFAAQPSEMIASVTNTQLLFIIIVIAAFYYCFLKLFKQIVEKQINRINVLTKQGIAAQLLLIPLVLIGLRGGLQLIPVNESSAVFSSHNQLNQVAINAIWYLGHNLHQSGVNETNPYQWMEKQTAADITHETLRKHTDDTLSIFNLSGKPNIVILLFESWTADIIEPLGGIHGVTPNFTAIANRGLLFSSVYSSGFRTDQALVSTLSGFPSQPNNSIIRFPAKAAQLPSLANTFKNEGYTNSFYYGGELGFANMNNYLVNSGYEKIVNINDFSSKHRNSKWGVHDEFVLEKQLTDLSAARQPFFSTLLTLSTHEPFEVPVTTPFNGTDEPELFKKAAWYTDYCLGNYFKKAQTMPWFSNTIFILVADHGHRLPMKRDYFDPDIRKIPLLIVSNLLKAEYAGKQIAVLANQHDLPATLLKNLNIADREFVWSVNIMDPHRKNYAYLSLDIAMTWKEDSTTVILPFQPGYEIFEGNEPSRITGKAYMQHLYNTFLQY